MGLGFLFANLLEYLWIEYWVLISRFGVFFNFPIEWRFEIFIYVRQYARFLFIYLDEYVRHGLRKSVCLGQAFNTGRAHLSVIRSFIGGVHFPIYMIHRWHTIYFPFHRFIKASDQIALIFRVLRPHQLNDLDRSQIPTIMNNECMAWSALGRHFPFFF